jgi:hypothetical protein
MPHPLDEVLLAADAVEVRRAIERGVVAARSGTLCGGPDVGQRAGSVEGVASGRRDVEAALVPPAAKYTGTPPIWSTRFLAGEATCT